MPSAAGALDGASKLPPSDLEGVAAIFDPRLAALGLRVARAGLQDPTDGYAASPSGTHFAVYVEPTGAYSNAQYVDGLLRATRRFLPKVFRRWKGLVSFDVCQEPPPEVDDAEVPAPLTQVWITRGRARALGAWRKFTLTDLFLATRDVANRRPGGGSKLIVFVDTSLRDEPAYVEALTSARARSAPTSEGAQRY